MRLIIGTGGCGFQRVNEIMNRFGQNTLYKISPVKMQNSIQVNFENFIAKAQSFNGVLIGSFYLKFIERYITNNQNCKVICLKGDKVKTTESLFIHFGFRNPLTSKRSEYSRYNLNFFNDYSEINNGYDAITKYYDDYYIKCEELKKQFPENIIIVDSKNYFENDNVQKECNQFFGINQSIIEERYFIKNKIEITTSLHGGLGNNLFQMIEPLVFSEINNLPSPLFSTWDCSDLPSCNNSDIILGGHGGTWVDFKNSFKHIKFIEPTKADFDTKFMINDMFDFKILHKYKDIILNKFQPSDSILEHINQHYNNILNDSCSLHIRTCKSAGDTHVVDLNQNYYENALNTISSKNILVFTDNISECYNTLNQLINKFNNKIFHLINENQFVSLFLMSMCDNNILNISTFSFWGGYLNKKQNNKIIIPNNFGHNPNMLCHDEWIKI
jgi:hypothetical protein